MDLQVLVWLLVGALVLAGVISLAQHRSGTKTAAQPPPPPAPQPSKEERLAQIEAFHGNDLNTLTVRLADCGIKPADLVAAGALVERTRDRSIKMRTGHGAADLGLSIGNAINQTVRSGFAMNALGRVVLSKTLNDMDDGARALVRLADILHLLGGLTVLELRRIYLVLAWSGGNCLIDCGREITGKHRQGVEAGVAYLMKGYGDTSWAYERVQAVLRAAVAEDSFLIEDDRRILERYLFAGSRWLTPAEAPASSSAAALKLGVFEGTDHDYDYDRRESLITIAPPGAGKSQAHVIRNLLNLRAPAVVLDIKGEAFKTSGRWRKDNVGPIYAFAPTLPNVSMHYNPLDRIGTGHDAWDDARRLADLLVVPNNSDAYFENRARDLLTIALLDVALNEPPELRNMSAVIDRLYLNDEEFEAWLETLSESKMPMLRRQSNAWRTMPTKQREAVFDSARNHLEAWQSPALAGIVEKSEFRFEDLRARNGTLYLCINLEDVKKYASVIRVIIGQAIGALCRGEAEANASIVTFFLDEMPRLGRMDVIEEGLDTARGYGVRFWLFCQNFGQLRAAYPNADGILGSCAVRCYMDPDDDTAEELSRYLGQRRGLIDGKQKALAEASELKGPAFADKVIVFTRGKPPAKLVRRMAFAEQPVR